MRTDCCLGDQRLHCTHTLWCQIWSGWRFKPSPQFPSHERIARARNRDTEAPTPPVDAIIDLVHIWIRPRTSVFRGHSLNLLIAVTRTCCTWEVPESVTSYVAYSKLLIRVQPHLYRRQPPKFGWYLPGSERGPA